MHLNHLFRRRTPEDRSSELSVQITGTRSRAAIRPVCTGTRAWGWPCKILAPGPRRLLLWHLRKSSAGTHHPAGGVEIHQSMGRLGLRHQRRGPRSKPTSQAQ